MTMTEFIQKFELSGKKLPLGITKSGRPYCQIGDKDIAVFFNSVSTVDTETKICSVHIDLATAISEYKPNGSKVTIWTIGSNLTNGEVEFPTLPV